MDDKALKELLSGYRQGSCTEEERALLENWVSVTIYPEYVISEKELQKDFDLIASVLPLVEPKEKKLWPRITGISLVWKIAAAVTVMTLGVWLYYTSSPSTLSSLVSRDLVAMNDIAPGKNTATLTLANGEVINLSEAKKGVVIDATKLSYADGEQLSISSASAPRRGDPEASSETTQFPGSRTMSVSTPRGGQYQVVLADGTKVWLNADSKITFPSQFSGGERRILLQGEGYFEVSKNKNKPFIVETAESGGRQGQQVEVLGTHFNINSYADEGTIKTTLLEGSVKVSPLAIGGRLDTKYSALNTILKPGQQVTLTGNQQIQVKEVDVELAIAWKQGYFRFNEENLASIMRKLEKWYDIQVVMSAELGKKEFTGKISRDRNISRVLAMLEKTNSVRFKIEGRRVTAIE